MKLIHLLLVVLMVQSCSSLPSTLEDEHLLKSVKSTDNLQLELVIESAEIKSIDDIKAQFNLKNITERELVFSFPSGCQFGYRIVNDNRSLFDSRDFLGCTLALSELRLDPGEIKNFPIIFDRFDIDLKFDEGIYELEAFLLEGHSDKIMTSFKVE